MKLIGRLLLYVLIACVVVIFGFYFLLQTRWGADHVSNWVSENSGYHLTFDVMDHRFSAPSHLLLENVTFGRDGQPATLVAKTVDIGLSIRQLTAPLHVDTILLQDGTLNIQCKPPLSRLRPTACNFAIWRSIVPAANGG